MPHKPSFWLAAALSLALHGAMAGLLLFGPERGGSGELQPVALGILAVASAAESLPLTVLPSDLPQPRVLVPVIPKIAAPLAAEAAAPAPIPLGKPSTSTPIIRAGHGTGGDPSPPATAEIVRAAPTFFQVTSQGHSVVYVLDRSSSMGLNLSGVRRELLKSLSELAGDVRFQVVFYNRQAQMLDFGGPPGLVAATAENKERGARQLEALSPEGQTDHLIALRLALSFRPDVIFFLTDADDLSVETVNKITQLNRGRSMIHALELTTANRDRPDMPLQALARQNRGQYRIALAR